MAYQKNVLDGYTYPLNPPDATNPPVRGIAVTESLTKRYYTDWGSDPSRREITQSWPVMSADMYNSLAAKFAIGGTLSFTDENGTGYTVIFASLTYQKATPRTRSYLSVTAKFYVVSSP